MHFNHAHSNLLHSLIFLLLNHLQSLSTYLTPSFLFSIFIAPTSSTLSEPFSTFLDDFTSFLSTAATTPHEFIINGDFNIHMDNPTDHITSQFLTVLSHFYLTQHVDFPTHNKNHILDLVITSSDSSLALSLSTGWRKKTGPPYLIANILKIP